MDLPMFHGSVSYIIELAGVSVFAASGVFCAGRKGMDLLGVVVIALVTALGGGTLRDILLERHPLFWIADITYLWVGLVATLIGLVYVRFRNPPEQALLVADALGLAFFTIVGTKVAENAGYSGIISVIMGTITGTAGGVIRDVLSAEIPLLFRSGRLYATAAIFGATLYVALRMAGVSTGTAEFTGMAVITAVRFAAIVWNIKLPVAPAPPVNEDSQTL